MCVCVRVCVCVCVCVCACEGTCKRHVHALDNVGQLHELGALLGFLLNIVSLHAVCVCVCVCVCDM